jgi:hypothetical protein
MLMLTCLQLSFCHYYRVEDSRTASALQGSLATLALRRSTVYGLRPMSLVDSGLWIWSVNCTKPSPTVCFISAVYLEDFISAARFALPPFHIDPWQFLTKQRQCPRWHWLGAAAPSTRGRRRRPPYLDASLYCGALPELVWWRHAPLQRGLMAPSTSWLVRWHPPYLDTACRDDALPELPRWRHPPFPMGPAVALSLPYGVAAPSTTWAVVPSLRLRPSSSITKKSNRALDCSTVADWVSLVLVACTRGFNYTLLLCWGLID